MGFRKNKNVKSWITMGIFFTMLFVMIQGCSSYYSFNKNIQNKIFLRGPGSCIQLILFDDKGNGVAIKGRAKGSEYKRFDKLKSIEVANQFKIKSSDMDDFNTVIKKLKNAKIFGKPKNDARHIEVYLHNSKKVDTYNFTEELVMELLFLLNENISHDINNFCEPIGVID